MEAPVEKHSATHENHYSVWNTEKRRPCTWLEPRDYLGGESLSHLAGFGIDRCNEHAEAFFGGLHYSTKSATLIAANDGIEFGVYVFRTPGGRFFKVTLNYPLRYDRTDPLMPITEDEAMFLWGECNSKSYAVADPFAEAFPGRELVEA
jgi:hypothetical protein